MNPIVSTLLAGAWSGIALGFVTAAVLLWLDRSKSSHRAIVTVIAVVLMWRYMAWRVTGSLPPAGFTLDFAAGVIFLGVEMLSMISTSLSLFFLTRTRDRTPDVEANMAWLLAQAPPRVDVLICTYNEERSILEQTIVGAMSMTHPNFRVWVCDDGRRRWLEELCAQHGCGYITRSDNAHAKAGNINNALLKLYDLPDPPDFVSILDADFVPRPNFLTRALALFRDPSIGIVQTPQHFVNPDPIQGNLSLNGIWPDEQRYFFDVLMASKDAWGAAFCCGTSSVIRFKPLLRIGGFPTDSVTEDYLVTLRLREIGYQTAYLNEQLSLGLAPEGLKEYITQRSRWCLGFVQICRGRSGPLNFANNLKLADRIILSETFLYWSATHAFRLLALIVPILYLLFDIQAVNASLEDALSAFLPYFVIQMGIMSWMTKGRVLPIMADISQLLGAHTILKAVWSGLVNPVGQKFKVTAKGGDRDVRFVEWSLLRWFLIYLGFTVAGILAAFAWHGGWTVRESSAIALFWSWYNLVILTITCFVCIEQPRKRKAERFLSGEKVGVARDGETQWLPVLDISTGGMRIGGASPAGRGERIAITLGSVLINGSVVRVTPDDFAVRVEDDLEHRKAMIRHIYAGRYSASVEKVKPRQVLQAILARTFR